MHAKKGFTSKMTINPAQTSTSAVIHLLADRCARIYLGGSAAAALMGTLLTAMASLALVRVCSPSAHIKCAAL